MSELDNELNPEKMTTIRPSNSDTDLTFVVRPDKREPAFRRYENYIARALVGPYILNPRTEPQMNVSPATFCARFNDAKLGFIDYGYASVIPHTDAIIRQLRDIVARELLNGEVRVFNKRRDTGHSGERAAIVYSTTDLQAVGDKYQELIGGLWDMLTLRLPEGSDEDRMAALDRVESYLGQRFGRDEFGALKQFVNRTDAKVTTVTATRRPRGG